MVKSMKDIEHADNKKCPDQVMLIFGAKTRIRAGARLGERLTALMSLFNEKGIRTKGPKGGRI